MSDHLQKNADSTSPVSDALTAQRLREHSRMQIELLSKNVFKALQNANTESLIVYLIIITLDPIVRAYLDHRTSIDELIKKIWPKEYDIFKTYLEKDKLNINQLSASVQTLLDQDDFVARILETLLIFVEVIHVMEKYFQSHEWVLQELRRELQVWHRQGKFQRIEVSIPSERLASSPTSRGDLQTQVSASKPTCIAGQEFSVFVVINNPFEVPLVLYSVETQIPVDLVDVVSQQQYRTLLAEDPSFKRAQNSLWANIMRVTLDTWKMNLRMMTVPESRIARAVTASELDSRRQEQLAINMTMNITSMSEAQVIGAQIDKYYPIDINIESASPQQIDDVLWRLESYKKGLIPVVLQPGDSVVHQFIFRTKSWLFFTPLAHTLQIQIRYKVDNRDHLDSTRFDLTIQAAITATIVGSVIGGAVGAIARLLSDMIRTGTVNVSTQVFGLPQLLSLLLAVILSALTVVSFARKSGVQQIISVEDFWGGLFLGFLIGFLGQNFALSLIKPSGATPSP